MNQLFKYLIAMMLLFFALSCSDSGGDGQKEERCNPVCASWQTCYDGGCVSATDRCADKSECLADQICNDQHRCVEKSVDNCAETDTFEAGLTPLKTLHVATTGSGENSGTVESPFGTIAQAVAHAEPGTAIVLHSGTYSGGNYITELSGTEAAPIWIGGAEGEAKPVIQGGTEGIHLIKVHYLVIHNLKIAGATANGINIDDGGEYDNNQATHHVIFRDLEFSGIGTGGNNDQLKMSGVYDFQVLNSHFTGTGSGTSGSGIDMVGCHNGLIKGNHFSKMSANGIQAKGGTADIDIINNHFLNAGYRSINMGGSTGDQFFRPSLSETERNYEAKKINVISNLIQGAEASLAFVGCVECLVANNTIINPTKWIFRILQEKTSGDTYQFEPCRDNQVINNIIYFDRSQISTYINIGGNTAPETFIFSNNLWYAHDNPANSTPTNIPVTESNPVIGEDPGLDNNFKISTSSPAYQKGVALDHLSSDMDQKCYLNPPSIGVFEVE